MQSNERINFKLFLLLIAAETANSTMSYDKYPMEIGLVYRSAMMSLVKEVKVQFKVLRAIAWFFLVVMAIGLLVGVAVKKAVILVVLGGRWSCRGSSRT